MARIFPLSFAFALLPAFALAQAPSTQIAPPLSYDIHSLSFDRWCQEDEHFSSARCDARQPEDVQNYENYRDKVEQYDLKYQQDRTKENQFEKDVLKRDHTAPATTPDVIAPSQQ